MRFYLFSILISLITVSACGEKIKDRTVHRRNFSKNVFEEEFASVKVGCDTVNMNVILPDTKWIDIDDAYISNDDPKLHVLKMNKILKATERTFKHDLVLEKIQNGAFMFRYTGKQVTTDTLTVLKMSKVNILPGFKIDSSRIFSYEGRAYYNLTGAKVKPIESEIIYKNWNVEDKGRVVCTCDYYTTKS